MKQLIRGALLVSIIVLLANCRTTKTINKVIAPKDTVSSRINIPAGVDSATVIREMMDSVRRNHIDFKTFNAKIKVEYQDSKEKTGYHGYCAH